MIDNSFTFSGLPRKGNTPKLSRPTTANPHMANAFAESPSVKISVQWDLVPAKFASSNFGITNLYPFFFLSCLDIFCPSLLLIEAIILSTIPVFSIYLIDFYEMVN